MPAIRIGPSDAMLGKKVNKQIHTDEDPDNPWMLVTNLTKNKTLAFKLGGTIMYLLGITQSQLSDILFKVQSPIVLGKDGNLYYIRYLNSNRFVACTTEEFLKYYPNAPKISEIPYQRCFGFLQQIAKYLNRDNNMGLAVNIAMAKPGVIYTGVKKEPPKPWYPNTWLHKPLNQYYVATTQKRNNAKSRCETFWVYRFPDEDPNQFERGDRLVEQLMIHDGVEIPWDTNYFYLDDKKKQQGDNNE